MKNIIVAVSLIVGSSFANAAITQTLVELSVTGGFVAPAGNISHGVRIISDGQVLHFDESGKEDVIAKLSPERVEALRRAVESIPAAVKLVDSSPASTACADVPDETYTVYNSAPAGTMIANLVKCHLMIDSANGSSEMIRNVLNGFYELQNMQ